MSLLRRALDLNTCSVHRLPKTRSVVDGSLAARLIGGDSGSGLTGLLAFIFPTSKATCDRGHIRVASNKSGAQCCPFTCLGLLSRALECALQRLENAFRAVSALLVFLALAAGRNRAPETPKRIFPAKRMWHWFLQTWSSMLSLHPKTVPHML